MKSTSFSNNTGCHSTHNVKEIISFPLWQLMNKICNLKAQLILMENSTKEEIIIFENNVKSLQRKEADGMLNFFKSYIILILKSNKHSTKWKLGLIYLTNTDAKIFKKVLANKLCILTKLSLLQGYRLVQYTEASQSTWFIINKQKNNSHNIIERNFSNF